MDAFEDPLDLLNDDGDGVIEACLLEEEEKSGKGGGNKNTGCCVVFLALCSPVITIGLAVSQIL